MASGAGTARMHPSYASSEPSPKTNVQPVKNMDQTIRSIREL